MSSDSSAADGDLGAGSRVAGYVLQQQIGRGGMAVVFRAHDERLNRLVALKVLAPGLAADTSFRQRFIRESQAAAAVDDPHIIPVFEAGEASGVLFIAMRYVGGGDVGSLLRREGPLPPARMAAILSPVASALDAAHEAGLVHRDVKPANMLLDARPGRPEHVYVSDFGLSKAVLAVGGLTGSGVFLGTLDYVAPEQIKAEPVDGRADQYALASAAFELLTGSVPFQYDGATAIMYAKLEQPPPALTSRRPDLPTAVDAVLARALARAAADRYPTCRDFSEGLRAALGLSPYASGTAQVGVRSYEDGARSYEDGARSSVRPAAASTAEPVRDRLWQGEGSPAGSAWPGSRPTLPELSPDHPRPSPGHDPRAAPGRDHRPGPGRHLQPSAGRHPRRRPQRRPWIWLASVLAVAALVAVAVAVRLVGQHSANAAPPGTGRSVCTKPPAWRPADWTVRTRARPLLSLGHIRGHVVEGLAFSPDGSTVVVGTLHATYLINTASRHVSQPLRDPGGRGVEAVAMSCDGAVIAVADANGKTYLWRTDGTRAATLPDPEGQELRAVAFSPDGKMLAAGDASGTTYLWQTSTLWQSGSTGKPRVIPTATLRATRAATPAASPAGPAAAQALAFSADSHLLAVGASSGYTYLWRLGSAGPAAKAPARLASPAAVQAVAFSRDGRTLAAGDASGGTSLWDLGHGARLPRRQLADPGAPGPYGTVALAFNGTTLAAGGYSGQTYLWDTATDTLITTVTDPGSGLNVQAVAFSPDGRSLATGDTGGSAYLWTDG